MIFWPLRVINFNSNFEKNIWRKNQLSKYFKMEERITMWTKNDFTQPRPQTFKFFFFNYFQSTSCLKIQPFNLSQNWIIEKMHSDINVRETDGRKINVKSCNSMSYSNGKGNFIISDRKTENVVAYLSYLVGYFNDWFLR